MRWKGSPSSTPILITAAHACNGFQYHLSTAGLPMQAGNMILC